MHVLLDFLLPQGRCGAVLLYSIVIHNRKNTCLTQCNTYPSDNQSKINNHQHICTTSIWTWNQKLRYLILVTNLTTVTLLVISEHLLVIAVQAWETKE